jgi:hypothetical protein
LTRHPATPDGIAVPYRTEQVLLTLAGLAYRGFHDLRRGALHADAVRRALLDGLHALPPVKDEWVLVWGPATSRSGPEAFDSAAMYVVRHRRTPTRYVVVIRGTNPISASDWLFGDFWVSSTVPWPYAGATHQAAISASSALGLGRLQAMRSPRLELQPVPDRGRQPATQDAASAQVARIALGWRRFADGPTAWLRNHVAGRLESAVSLSWTDLRSRSLGAPGESGLDLLTFLADEAHAAGEPLDVVVTGHSKGGALAAVVALWLRDLLVSPDAVERWDGGRGARVACHAFAAPTPGNAAFADRIDAVLGSDHRHLRNMNDVVTHAWQVDELEQIPELYAPRRTVLETLIPVIASRIKPIGYRQARAGVTTFEGALRGNRSFEAEFVHQHLDAYLAELGLLGQEMSALTFFF